MKKEILGVKIDNLTTEEALQKVESFLKENQQRYIVTPNPEFLVLAQKDKEFKRILNQADLAISDGVGLILAARFLGQSLKQRVSGTDLMEKICQKAAQKKWPVFLLGGVEGIAEKAAENLRRRYPGLKIKWSSFRRGPFDYSLGPDLGLKGPNSFGPLRPKSGILFIALGAPKQEKWIAQNLAKMPSVKLAMGVGGAFDFISGQVPRAPKFLRAIGLEWFWRLSCQPWRIKRIFKAVVKFPWLVLKSKSTK